MPIRVKVRIRVRVRGSTMPTLKANMSRTHNTLVQAGTQTPLLDRTTRGARQDFREGFYAG